MGTEHMNLFTNPPQLFEVRKKHRGALVSAHLVALLPCDRGPVDNLEAAVRVLESLGVHLLPLQKLAHQRARPKS